MENIIELKKLKKYYGPVRGIEDVSLKIKRGEIYGFIGPNGAGKSTTIRTIMGLINKTEGTVLFDGKTIDYNDTEIKKKIGYLSSEVRLYGDMSVKEIFDYHESFYDKDMSKRRKYLTKKLKIDENRKIDTLSLGNLKKVGIVLALMHEPELLILDEPTSGLDPLMQNTLHNILIEEKEKGTAILYSSHILSEVSNLCDKVGFIKEGTIIKEGKIEDMLKNDYTNLTISSPEIDKIKDELNLKIKSKNKNEITFINDIDINILIKKLSKYKIDKLLIEPIPLEDLFAHYYK